MRDLNGVLLERGVAVRIAIRIKRQSHFITRGFLTRFRRRNRGRSAKFFRCLPRRAELLPKQRVWGDLTCWILLLQGFQLPLQLAQGKRHAHLRGNEERLHKEH